MSGVKHDADKPRMALVPPRALEQVAKAFTIGAERYGQYNYLDGLTYTRMVSAALRHINAFLQGHDIDVDSGVASLGCAVAELMMCLESQLLGVGVDDRYAPYYPPVNKVPTCPTKQDTPQEQYIASVPEEVTMEDLRELLEEES